MAPVYHEIATKTPADLVTFLKIDCDDCDDIARSFEIKAYPTFKLFRVFPPKPLQDKEKEELDTKNKSSFGINAKELYSVEGIPKPFGQTIAQQMFKNLTSEENEAFERTQKRMESDAKAAADGCTIDGISSVDVAALSTLPLMNAMMRHPMVSSESREKQNMRPIDSTLPFDLSGHPQTRTHIAQLMIARMKKDTKIYAEITNKAKTLKLTCLKGDGLRLAFEYPQRDETRETIQKHNDRIESFMKILSHMKSSDQSFVSEVIPLLSSAANHVRLTKSTKVDLKDDAAKFIAAEAFGGSKPGYEFRVGPKGLGYYLSTVKPSEEWSVDRLYFALRRFAGQEALMEPQFLFASTLSTTFRDDMKRLNPYIEDSDMDEILQILVGVIMRSSRIGHINRCILMAIKVQKLLRKADTASSKSEMNTLRVKAEQISQSFAKLLMTRRHFMSRSNEVKGAWNFDPRYLIFEFTWNIILRPKQYAMVVDFVNHLKSGKSKVKQLIMGAGKTAVVTPLLSLITGDGETLVVVMVPRALLDQSRQRLRETFSTIITKRVYTLAYDRSSSPDKRFVEKLETAAESRGVCVCTPTTIKSIMLGHVEILENICDEGFRGRKASLEKDAANLKTVLKLFSDGVALIDEVDLVLHPLKSELNFPIGDKFELDMSGQGERWALPIHLFDALFFRTRERSSVFQNSSMAQSILRRISSTIEKGIKVRAIQENPHLVLLNMEWYHEHLKPVMAEWAYLWLQSVHLHGATRSQAISYILMGASARSESGRRLETLTSERLRLEAKLGIRAPGPKPSLTLRKSLSEEKHAERNKSAKNLMRQISDDLNETERAQLEKQLDAIIQAQTQSRSEFDLIEGIYDAEEKMTEKANSSAKTLAEMDARIADLKNRIDAIENPHDDSLDNTVVIWVSVCVCVFKTKFEKRFFFLSNIVL